MRDYKCYICKVVGRLCDHIIAKCVNCQGLHWANNPECEMYRVVYAAKNDLTDELIYVDV